VKTERAEEAKCGERRVKENDNKEEDTKKMSENRRGIKEGKR
jgi:hypothetical protein